MLGMNRTVRDPVLLSEGRGSVDDKFFRVLHQQIETVANH